MKKIFEKNPMFHYTFVLAVISIACGIVIGGVYAITDPIIQDNLETAKVESYNEVLDGLNSYVDIEVTGDYPSSVNSIVEGKNATNEVIGYIYEVQGTNQHGSMTIIVSVDPEGTILGAQFLKLDQTKELDNTRYNLSLYIGSSIDNLVMSGDLISGVTNSLITVRALLADVATAFELSADPVASDPLVSIYGEGYVIEDDSTFSPTNTSIDKSNVLLGTENVGTVYYLSGNGEYMDGSFDSIVLVVYFDADGYIVATDLPEDTYNHTPTAFKTMNETYLEGYIGLTLADIVSKTNEAQDITSGASNTTALINELLEALVNEVA